jgi:hypothetical protein
LSPPGSHQEEHLRTPTLKTGRANYTTVKEIPTGEEVLASTYYSHEHPIVILFNSGASHDFMSLSCAQKTNLLVEKIEVLYLILTP